MGFIHPAVIQAIRIVVVELGGDVDSLFSDTGIDLRSVDGSKPVQYTAVGRLISLAVGRTGCPHLGLLVGQRTTLASFGPVGVLLRNCASIGDALRVIEAHLCVRDRGAVVGIGIYDEIAVLTYALHEPEAEGAPLHLERALATMTNVLRELCAPGWAPLEVTLPRSPPHDTTPYTRHFQAPVRFNQEQAALILPAAFLKQRITDADPSVRQRVEEDIRRLEADQPSTLTDELCEYLQVAVTRERCRAQRVACLKQMNRRTLCRRLRAEGTSFTELNSAAQFRTAKQLLADTSMSMTQISAALDFSEPAAFTHAFRRWAGVTPSAWRQMNQSTVKREEAH